MSNYKILTDKFPFLTIFEYAEEEFVGIIQNQSKNMTSVYMYENVHGKENKVRFLELGETWWWESNRKIPINLFLKNEFDMFDSALRCFSTKDVNIIQGHSVSLANINEKRIKRRKVELVRNPDTSSKK